MTPEAPQELLDLANAYIEGKLDKAEKTRLEDWLKNDPKALRIFSDFLHDHSAMYWEHVETGGIDIEELTFDVPRRQKRQQVTNRWQKYFALASAACLTGGFYLFYLSIQQGTVTDSTGYSQGPNRVQSTTQQGTIEPNTVARVCRIEGEALINEERSLTSGQEISAGENLKMETGLIEMVFHETGVHVIATAPLSLSVTSNEHLRLRDGELKLHVPPQGIGFVVETEERRITDLGTSFVVAARPEGSKVFVLDGQIAVAHPEGGTQRLMEEGEIANFNRSGETKIRTKKLAGLPELPLLPLDPDSNSLQGTILSLKNDPKLPKRNKKLEDRIGRRILPLIQSGFRDESCLDNLKQGNPARFTGIAGAHSGLPEYADLDNFPYQFGWLAWYSGKVAPPTPGKYRFWGYADNHLLVAIDGKPVFEGSRFDSSLRDKLNTPRTNHPSFPCLNSEAGFASGEWIELDGRPVKLDILFGEMSNVHTSGLLLIEKEGAPYEETFWGQPRWPLFLTEMPDYSRITQLNKLSFFLEEKLQGAFSVSGDAIWQVSP